MDTNTRFQASLGHRKSACHPAMRPFLLSRNQCVIDLIAPHHTQDSLARASSRLATLRTMNAQRLWVGDRRSAKLLAAIHQRTGDPIIATRWPGGLLTNYDQVSRTKRGCLTGLCRKPEVVILLSVHASPIALTEAKRCGIEVVGVVDTNADPTSVHVPILANDDAMTVISELLGALTG